MTVSATHPWENNGRIKTANDLLDECEICGRFSNIAGYECADPFEPLTRKVVKFLCPRCNDIQQAIDWQIQERACNDSVTTQMPRTGIKV